eukprot:360772-Chlamydomonas_euryale.AAC.4
MASLRPGSRIRSGHARQRTETTLHAKGQRQAAGSVEAPHARPASRWTSHPGGTPNPNPQSAEPAHLVHDHNADRQARRRADAQAAGRGAVVGALHIRPMHGRDRKGNWGDAVLVLVVVGGGGGI